jgi:hypothetical protein
MAYVRANPIVFRLPKPETRALHALAARAGLTANRYMKRLALEQIVTVDSGITDNERLDGYLATPTRSAIAPENRAAPEIPANRSGFAERSK